MERAGAKLDTILIPKVGTPADVLFVATLLDQIEQRHGLAADRHPHPDRDREGHGQRRGDRRRPAPTGWRRWCSAWPTTPPSIQARTTNIGGANPDYAVLTDPDAGGERELHWGDQWHFALSRMVAACRADGLRPIDGPFGDYQDAEGYRPRRGAPPQLGCEGKWAIHPSQVALANEVFTPSEAEVERARRILEAMEQAADEGKGAVSLDGKLIDAASIRMAENLVRKVDQMAVPA